MSIQSKYFFLAIVIVGSIGIWLPILLQGVTDGKVDLHGIPPNITTYFVSILFAGSIDFFLGKIKKLNSFGITNVFLDFIFLIIGCLALVFLAVFLSVKGFDWWSLLVGCIGVILSYCVWWRANVNNPYFSIDSEASIGGDPLKPLNNG